MRKTQTITLKLNKRKYLGFYACCGTLGLLLLAMIFPLDINFASATDSDSSSTRVELTIGEEEDFTPGARLRAASASTISVSLATTTPLTVAPESAGTFSSGSTTVDVYTTAKEGYDIFVNSATSTTGSNRLTKTGDSAKYLSPTSNTVTSSTMTKNTWGYTMESGAGVNMNASGKQFKTVPLTAGTTPVLSGAKNATGTLRKDQYTLGFGAKVDQTLPTGEYTSNVTVSVIARPEVFTDIRQFTYMQEMTSNVCKNTYTPTSLTDTHIEKQLIDERDGKAYWVTKMADGNCWMTQNLALDISGTKRYNKGGMIGGQTSTGVPVASTTNGDTKFWTGSASSSDRTGNLPKVTEGTIRSGTGENYYYDTQSWNFGNYVLTRPLKSDASNYCIDYGINNYNQSLSSCSAFVTNVGSYVQVPYRVYGSGQGYKFSPSASATIGNTSSVISGDYYDAHYLIGNYYQYNAAMAGSAGDSISSGTPAWSICPAGADVGKNWRPAIGDGYWGSTANEQFGSLFMKYGMNDSSYDSTAGSVQIQKLPFAFIRSGYVIPVRGNIERVAHDDIYWSRTVYAPENAYRLRIHATSVGLSNVDQRSYGGSLRCLYPGV